MYHTYRELTSQSDSLQKTFDYFASKKDELIGFYQRHSPKRITYIACGSSYLISQSAELSARVKWGIPATALTAGDLMLHCGDYHKVLEGSLLIVPTRSGSTSEVLLAIRRARTLFPVPVLAITCVADSEVARLSEFTLELPWAFDESVCQTRTVTNLYLANLLVIAYLSGDRELIAHIDQAIRNAPHFMERVEPKLADIAEEEWHDVVVLADGELQGIAREGALAFTEISRIPGDYYHLLDVRHGPIVLIGRNTLVLAALSGEGLDYEVALIGDLIKHGAKVIAYCDLPHQPIAGVRLQVDFGRRLDPAVRGIPFIFIAQALAYYKAVKRGVNPDQPEGLAAWIKL